MKDHILQLIAVFGLLSLLIVAQYAHADDQSCVTNCNGNTCTEECSSYDS